MGQDIKYIAIKEGYDIPVSIIHFKEKDSIIIPVDMDGMYYSNLFRASSKLHTLEEFLTYVTNEDEVILEETAIEVFDLIKRLDIDSLVFIRYREILDVPQMNDAIIIKDYKIIPPDEEDPYIEKPHSIIGLNSSRRDIISNEDHYHSYSTAFYEYNKDNPALPK